MKQGNYQESRNLMRPGDVIAFEGSGPFAEMVRVVTKSRVSHVGIVLQSRPMTIEYKSSSVPFLSDMEFVNHIIETAWVDGGARVVVNRLSDRIEYSKGAVWWLSLSGEVRERMDFNVFYDFLVLQKGLPYDIPQAVKSAVDIFDRWPVLNVLTRNREDFGKWFCSELVAAGLERAGGIKDVNCSEVTPVELCRWGIYNDCVQIAGEEAMEIRGFNKKKLEGYR